MTTTYYETAKKIARQQVLVAAAIERGDACSAGKHFVRYMITCWNPIAQISFWREVASNGWGATYREGLRGAIDGLAS